MKIGIVPFDGEADHIIRKWRYDVLVRRLPAFGHSAEYFRDGREYDAVVVSLSLGNESLLNALSGRGVPLLGDITDDILSFPYSIYTPPGRLYYWLKLHLAERRFARYSGMLRKCRGVIAGSPAQRERFSRLCPRAADVVDAVTDDILSLRAGGKDPAVRRIGWLGNVSSLHGFRELGGALDELAAAGGCELRLITSDYRQGRYLGRYPRDVHEFMRAQKIACRWVPWSPSTFAAELAACDIGIVPVDRSSPFFLAKPAGRALLMMGMGLPVVAGAVDSHVRVIEEGVTGYIAAEPGQWAAALLRLARDPDLRRRTGTAAAAFVRENFSEEAFAARYAAAIDRLTSGLRPGPAPGSP